MKPTKQQPAWQNSCRSIATTPTIRVLVVEDFAPFLEFICSILRKESGLQIIGEVSDGLAAVQKAEELQPDLILLDIGLPKLNGIEAARRIRKLSPGSRILFMSQESSADMVQAALATGAKGYVVKMDVRRDLLMAVNAVLRGEQFVGRRFADHDFTGASDAGTSEGLRSNSLFAPLQQRWKSLAATRSGSILMMQVFWMTLLNSSGPHSRQGMQLSSSRPSHTGTVFF